MFTIAEWFADLFLGLLALPLCLSLVNLGTRECSRLSFLDTHRFLPPAVSGIASGFCGGVMSLAKSDS